MNDNDYSDFVGFGQSPRYVAMPAWYKDKDEEKKEEENGGNASEGWKMGQGGNMAPAVVNEQVEVKQPSISAPAGNTAVTGAGGADLGKMNNMAVKQSAGGVFSDLLQRGGFDAPYRGKRTDNGGVDQTGGTGITDPNAVASMGSEGGNASGGWKVGQSGSMMPKVVKDPAGVNSSTNGSGDGGGGWMSDYEAYKQGLKDGAAGGGTSADAGETEAEVGQGEYPQTWDEFMKKMKEMDENYRKGENRRNWWELMTRGLVGAANLYGTTKGAPALDLSDSKEAFSNKDAYARLKDEKQTMYNVVNKEIERRQKAEAAALKASDLERRWQQTKNKIKIDQEAWDKKKDKYEEDIKKAKTENRIKDANAIEAEYKAKMKEFDFEHQQDLYDLRVGKQQADIAKSEAAAYKYYNGGGKSSGGSKAKGTRVDVGGKSYYFGTGAKLVSIASDAGAPNSALRNEKTAMKWIQKNINKPEVKRYIRATE